MNEPTTPLATAPRGPAPATLASPDSRHMAALFLLRSAAAAPLFFHGSQKLLGWFGGSGLSGFATYLEGLGVPFPTLSAALAAVSEVGGAVVLLAGLRAWTLVPVVFTLLVAVLTSARNGFDVQHGGAEFPLTLVLTLVAIGLLTPGRLAGRDAAGGAR